MVFGAVCLQIGERDPTIVLMLGLSSMMTFEEIKPGRAMFASLSPSTRAG